MSASAHLVVVLVSGPSQAARAQSGLDLAAAMLRNGAAGAVELLLLDEGCDHLAPAQTGAVLRRKLEDEVRQGLACFACSRSLSERDLVDTAHALGVRPVGAPVFLPSRAAAGAQLLIF